VFKNLIPAATERVYPGHFTINPDDGGNGRIDLLNRAKSA
jgi:hypothetical protein